MSEVPVQLVVAAFKSETAANQVLDELKLLQDAGEIKIDAAAVLYRDAKNELQIKDARDWGFGRGALAGGIIGTVLGIIAGPVGWAVLGGALIGGAAAKMHHTYGFDEARLRKIGEGLQPGDSAIIAVVEHIWVARVEATMREQSKDVFVESISKDIAEQLAAGSDVGYSVVGAGDTVAAERVAMGENETQISATTLTPDALVAEAADITKEKVTYTAAVADEKGVAGVVIEATPEPAPAEAEAKTPEPDAEAKSTEAEEPKPTPVG